MAQFIKTMTLLVRRRLLDGPIRNHQVRRLGQRPTHRDRRHSGQTGHCRTAGTRQVSARQCCVCDRAATLLLLLIALAAAEEAEYPNPE